MTEIARASASDSSELASFARRTYTVAYEDDIGLPAVHQHLTRTMSDEHFRLMLINDEFYVARRDDKLVGFAQVGLVNIDYATQLTEFDPQGSELRRLYVEPSLQSLGIGSALIEATLKQRSTKAKHVYLTTWETNVGAQRLYRKHGFQKVGQIPEYYADGKLNGYEHIMLLKPSP